MDFTEIFTWDARTAWAHLTAKAKEKNRKCSLNQDGNGLWVITIVDPEENVLHATEGSPDQKVAMVDAFLWQERENLQATNPRWDPSKVAPHRRT